MANEVENTEVAEQEQVVSGGEKTPVTFKDGDVVELTVDGKPERMTFKEAKDGWQRQQDYTRKTQGVSAKAKELQTIYEGLTTKQKELAEKEAAIDAILGRNRPNEKVNEPNPDDVLTVGQVKNMLKEFKDSLNGEVSTKLSQESIRNNEQRTFQRWEDMTNTAVESLTKENPILSKVPHLATILKQEAKRFNPTTEQEMVSAIIKAGKSIAEEFDKEYTERRKAETVRKEKLRSNGPAPKGGETVFDSPKSSYGKGRKINWGEIEKDVVAALEAEG